jgi:hypothetical protein
MSEALRATGPGPATTLSPASAPQRRPIRPRAGSFSVRRDRFVLVSPCARTDRPRQAVVRPLQRQRIPVRLDRLDRAPRQRNLQELCGAEVELRGFEPLTPSMRTERTAAQVVWWPTLLQVSGLGWTIIAASGRVCGQFAAPISLPESGVEPGRSDAGGLWDFCCHSPHRLGT